MLSEEPIKKPNLNHISNCCLNFMCKPNISLTLEDKSLIEVFKMDRKFLGKRSSVKDERINGGF